MIRRPPRSTLSSSSAASDVYKRQVLARAGQGRIALADRRCHLCRDPAARQGPAVGRAARGDGVGGAARPAGQPPGKGPPGAGPLEAMAWEYRRVLLAHRDAALVLANTPPVGPNRLRLAEQMLAMLVQAGFARSVAAGAGLLLVDVATNAVIEEGRATALRAAFGSGADGDGPGGFGQWFASLPSDEFPTLVAMAADLTDTDPQARFRFGIDVLLTGLR